MQTTNDGASQRTKTRSRASVMILLILASLALAGQVVMAQSSIISEMEAKDIALKTVPGEITDVAIEKKLGAKRYVVEVIAAADGAEIDVIIEMETGKVLGTER